METCKEIDGPNEMLIWEDLLNYDCTYDIYQNLQDKYNSLHETYIKEIENSKKVKRSLEKCLKIYSKLCKKFEAQQKVINNLQKTIEEKMNCLEESYKNQEKMKGLINIYKSERSLYSGESNFELKRDKEVLLDICCQLISESVKTNNIRNITNLILRKFKKDLNNEKINLLKSKQMKAKEDIVKINGQTFNPLLDAQDASHNVISDKISNQLSKENSHIYELKEENEECSRSNWEMNETTTESNEFPNHTELSNQKCQKLAVKSLEKPLEDCSNKIDLNQKSADANEKNFKLVKENESGFFQKTEEKKEYKNDNFKNKDLLLKSESLTVDLQVYENNDQAIPDFSKAKKEQSIGFIPALSENHNKLFEMKNSSFEENHIKLASDSTVSCQYSIRNELCFTTKKSNGNELSTAPSTVLHKDYSDLSELGVRNQTFSENAIETAKNMADEQEERQSNLKLSKLLKNKILQVSQDCEVNVVKDISHSESNKAENSNSTKDNLNALPLSLGNSDSFESGEFVKSNNKLNCSTFQDNFNKKSKLSFSEPAIGISESQKLLLYNQSIFEIPGTQSNTSISHSKNKKLSYYNMHIHSREKLVEFEKNLSHYATTSQDNTFNFHSGKENSCQVLPSKDGSDNKKNVLISDDSSNNAKDDNLELEFSFEKKTDVDMVQEEVSEEELSIIFSQMTSVRLLSPIREMGRRNFTATRESSFSVPSFSGKNGNSHLSSKSQESSISNLGGPSSELEKKRDNSFCFANRNKKFKFDETNKKKVEEKSGNGFLDSIMSAMSVQNKEFKSNVFNKGNHPSEKSENLINNLEGKIPSESSQNFTEEMNVESDAQEEKNFDRFQTGRKNFDGRSLAAEKSLKESIQKFVSSPNFSKEEADKNAKECISVLLNNSDEMIARVIVCMVFENVNEEVEPHDRPVPPLTRTQYRIIILLSILKAQDPRRENVSSIIMENISQKLFPDKWLWPDDAIEMASRFYIALCKNRNDIQTCWKFCLQAMMEIKQRSCLVVFVALKTWPDILHKASDLTNNLLALTVVNIFLHMPKGVRNWNQKLLGLKRILMGFYGFKVDETIENYAIKVLDSFFRNEPAAEKSLLLLAKCREVKWTGKHVIPKLLSTLKEWSENEFGDSLGHRILSVLKQIVPKFSNSKESPNTEEEEGRIISCLSEILTSKKANHEAEEKIIEVLLDLKRNPSARKVIREWIPKFPINDGLRNKIVSVSAENILKELKFNRRKDGFEKKSHDRTKKKKKKFKGKKGKKNKKRTTSKSMES